MKTTSDGIPAADWEKVHELAVTYANHVSSGKTNKARAVKRKMLSLLDGMETKFGSRPSILATKSDYLVSKSAREKLLLRAFKSARRRRDAKNQTLIASSLAELYLVDAQDKRKGRFWLKQLEQALQTHPDKEELSVHKELAQKLQQLDE